MATSATTRRSVAAHPETPPERLDMLAGDHVAAVRCAVAAHPHTPVGTLVELAMKDPDWRTRAAALANPSTPGYVIHVLAEADPAPKVRTDAQEMVRARGHANGINM